MASVSISAPAAGETFFKSGGGDPLSIAVSGSITPPLREGQAPGTQFEVDSVIATVAGASQNATTTNGSRKFTANVPIGAALGGLPVMVTVKAHIEIPSNGHFPERTEKLEFSDTLAITVAADSAPPAIKHTGTSYPNGTFPIVTVDFTVNDLSGLRSVQWRVAGGPESGAQDLGGGGWRIDRTDLRLLTGRGSADTVASPLPVELHATDRALPAGNEVRLTVMAADTIAPTVTLVAPDAGELFANNGAGATVTLAGSADDHWTGVASVQYQVDNGVWTDISLSAPSSLSVNWSTTHHLADAGPHVFAVRARDGAGNVSPPAIRSVEVARYLDVSAGDPLGSPAYLRDLLEFSVRSVTFPHTTAEPIGPGALVRLIGSEVSRIFRQPLLELLTPGLEATANAPVTELRPIIETMRRTLDAATLNLVAHWTLGDGDGPVALDATGNGFTGTIEGGGWVEGRDGRALSFDGETEISLTAELSAALSMETAVTMAAWVRPQLGADQTVLCKDNSYLLGIDPTGVVRWAFSTSTPWNWTPTTTTLAAGVWSHVAVTFDAGAVATYVNGRLVDGRQGLGALHPTDHHDVRIGARPGAFERWRGQMQDVRLYRGRVSAEIIARLAGLETQLLASWPLSEGSGPSAGDTVSGRPATLEGATWVEDEGKAVALTPADALRIDDTPALRVGTDDADFSVLLWLKVTGGPDGSWRGIIHKGAQDTERTFAIWLPPNDNRLHLRISTTVSGNEGIDATDRELPLDRWVHVAYIKAGRELVAYLDGTPAGQVTLTAASQPNSGPLHIGRTPWFSGFAGSVRGLTIQQGALTYAEVAQAATGGTESEADYRLEAYETLLAQLGTSYAEVRMSRSASAATRAGVAARLGIDLRPTRPDELDALFVEPKAVSEVWLESELGLRDTTRGVFSTPPPPTLLTAQSAALQRQWEAADSLPGAALLIDPDRLTESDFPADTEPLGIWRTRRAALADRTKLQAAARVGAGPAQMFDAAVQFGLGMPATHLDEVAAKRAAGTPIADDLVAIHLTFAMFDRLLSLQTLASTTVVTDDEWEELDDLLVQAYKLGLAASWRDQERVAAGGRPLVNGPEVFRLGAVEPEPRPWRYAAILRREWQDRLQMRVDQLTAVREAFDIGIRNAESLILPRLRDALAPAVQAALGCTDLDAVSERLLVDAADGGVRVGSRAGLAIQVMHGLLFGVRSTSFPPGHPANSWSIVQQTAGGQPEDRFDDEWRWMGSLDGWRAAMLVFFYPETIMTPLLRPTNTTVAETLAPTAAWSEPFLKRLRSFRSMTPAAARQLAAEYATAARALWTASLSGQPGWVTGYVPSPDAAPASQLSLNNAVFTALGAPLPHKVPPVVQEMLYFVPVAVAQQLQRSGEYVSALDWLQLVYNVALPADQRKIYRPLRNEANTEPKLSRTGGWLQQINPFELAFFHGANPYTRYTLTALAQCLLDFGDSEFTIDSPESAARARSLYLTARDLLRSPDLATPPGGSGLFGSSLLLEVLRRRAENQLIKLRQGRNIAGILRQADPSAAESQTYTPRTDASGAAVLTPPRRLQPTPYRFSVLLERSRQLVQVAEQVEAAYLQALEKVDAENYGLLRAGHDINLARAGEQLQRLRASEAKDNTELSRRQKSRVEYQQNVYRGWVSDGLNSYELATIDAYQKAAAAERWANGFATASAIAQGAISAAGAVSSPLGAPGAIAALGALTISAVGTGIARDQAITAQAQGQDAALRGSFERRAEEWQLQIGIADQDKLVIDQQIKIATDQEGIAAQEMAIAETQGVQAKAVADFLATKFTNAELYDWMSGVLAGVYTYFLQQATATAQLAQSQLGFERQVPPPTFIKDDYWTVNENATASSDQPDRRGFTGSVRLLQDITRLDQFAFESDRRKLNLTQTLSLATMFPFEFERFRSTGVLPFATPTTFFDRSFPGHYLRLIKRVRTSMVALIPATQGIRATLTASGVSRTVAGGETFQPVVIRRDPESVAFTSPTNATGVFELDLQSDMLLPFESMGVDTTWLLEMPPAANPIDYSAISDVLFTLEYTALSSSNYRSQVIDRIDPRSSSERAFRLREDFPDEWYDLSNPGQSSRPFTVRFTVTPRDFATNLEELRVAHVLVYVGCTGGQSGPVSIIDLQFTPAGQPAGSPGAAGAQTTDDGIVSTRRPNGSAWLPILGNPAGPVGTWQLTFDPSLEDLMAANTLDNVMMILSVTGRTRPWG